MDFNLRRSQYKTSFIELTGLVTACQLWESIDLMKPGGGGGWGGHLDSVRVKRSHLSRQRSEGECVSEHRLPLDVSAGSPDA